MIRSRAILFLLMSMFCMASCSPFVHDFVPEDDMEDSGQLPEEEPQPEEPYSAPVMWLEVEGMKPIVSKDDYVNVTVSILDGYEIIFSETGRVKGRGNATWGYPKKPYKVKFDDKLASVGDAAALYFADLPEGTKDENGGTTYRRTAGNYQGFSTVSSPCTRLCLCWLFNLFCCRGRFIWCC